MKNLNIWYLAPILSLVFLILAVSIDKSGFSALVFFLGMIASFVGYFALRKNKKAKRISKILLLYGLGTIIVLIFGLAVSLWVGYFIGLTETSPNYTSTQTSSDIQEYTEIKERSLRVLNENDLFWSKITESTISLKAGDTYTSRSKISEARNILIDLKKDFSFICKFQENNKYLFDEDIEENIGACEGYLDLIELCFPKLLDSSYGLTYLSEQADRIETGNDVKDFVKSCNSWLNEYNVVKGGCDTLSQKYDLNVDFPDFSGSCELN